MVQRTGLVGQSEHQGGTVCVGVNFQFWGDTEKASIEIILLRDAGSQTIQTDRSGNENIVPNQQVVDVVCGTSSTAPNGKDPILAHFALYRMENVLKGIQIKNGRRIPYAVAGNLGI